MTFRSFLPVVFLLSRACLLSCESNEIPLDDCSDCGGKLKTEIHTYSQPAWKDHLPASTPSTQKPDLNSQLHSTELVGTTNVVTHGVINHHETEEVTTEPGIETVKPKTKGYTTRTVKPTTKGYTTKTVKPTTKNSTTDGQQFTTKVIPSTKGYTTKVLPTDSPTAGSTSPQNQITTKSVDLTEPKEATKEATTESEFVFNTKMISPLYTGKFEVTTSDTPTTEKVTTENVAITTKATTETKIVTTEADIATTKTETASTEATVATTEASPIGGDTDVWGGDGDNEVDDSTNADPEYCVDHDKCYNGGESVCEKNGGDFLYCICQHGFTGTFCEQERSVAMVDDHQPRGSASFWDWKLSKYIIGGLGALTVIGLIMLTCMVVKCVKSGKEDRRRMEEYNAVGLETFIPPAPVVQTTLMGAAMDRGSSDVMDERSEEEFHLHDSDGELGDGPVQVHRLHHLYPDPEDDGLLHHAPSHRPGPSPDHYKVPTPTQNREYMNMNGKQNGKSNGSSPYMNGHYTESPKISPYMNGSANTYSHKLNDKSTDQYAHLNRSYSKNAQPQHNYLNLP